MRRDLGEGSRSYHQEADVYEEFSRAEDAQRKILRRLRRLVRGKRVVDIGCGTGKYAALLAAQTKSYTGIDRSLEELRIARKRAVHGHVRFLHADATALPLPAQSADLVLASWVFGTIKTLSRRALALREAERICAHGGRIIFIENDVGGSFERVRGRYPAVRRTQAYNRWLERHGLFVMERFTTTFGFSTIADARRVIGAIWGTRAAARVRRAKIPHRIVIYTKRKAELIV